MHNHNEQPGRIEEIVEALPGEEGWYKGGEKAWIALGQILEQQTEMDYDEIEKVLHDAYWAVASEYGA